MSRKNKILGSVNAAKRAQKNSGIIVGLFTLFMLALHPLFITPDTYQHITKDKMMFFTVLLVITLLALAVVAADLLTSKSSFDLSFKKLIKSLKPFEIALIAYWVFLFLSALFAKDHTTAWFGATARSEGFFMQTSYVIAFFIISRLYIPKERDIFLFQIAGILIAGYGICQFYGLDFLHFTVKGYEGTGLNLLYVSTLSNRNVISTFLCLCFCVSLAFFAQLKGGKRIISFVSILTVFYLILLGNTDSGYAGILVSFALFFAFLAKDNKSAASIFFVGAFLVLLAMVEKICFAKFIENRVLGPQELNVYLYVGLAVALLALSAILWLPFWSKLKISTKVWRIVWGVAFVSMVVLAIILAPAIAKKTNNATVKEFSSILSGKIDDSFGNGRGFLWIRSIELFKGRPVLGYGPDGFAKAFNEVYSEEAAKKYNRFFDKAHSEYVQTLVDVGILGFLALVSFYVLLILRARKFLDNPLCVALVFAMLCFMVQAFFNIAQPITTPLVWTMWGILGAIINNHEKTANISKKE